jgi:hypothetical protein
MNNLEAKTAYVGGTEIKQVRKGNRLVLAPNGNKLWYDSNEIPSLDLRFADTKSLVDATTGSNLVTFTRASSGTFVGSDGLIQSAVTNLLLRSEEFDNAGWLKTGSSVDPNVEVAPNGTLSADKIIEDTATSTNHGVLQSLSFTTGLSYTLSVFAKSDERQNVRLALPLAAFSSALVAQFNLALGTITTSSAGVTATIISLSNNWYRCIMTATATATATGNTSIVMGALSTSTAQNYTGDGTSGIYLWGAQLEQSSTVGEYIPTTSAINSAPRFDHNPTTGESLGLLVEEARTNLSQQSEDFSDAYWTKTSCTITSNESTAPDGTLTADLWSNTGTPGVISNSITKDATARTYTSSLWAKGGSTAFTLSLDNGGTVNRGRAVFNLSNGTLTSVLSDGNFTNTSGTITAYADGWYRLTVTTTTSTITTIRLRPFFSGSTLTVRIWGAQVEEGAFATSYIPTTNATVTRSADVASISGSNFSSWYRQDEGTFFWSGSTYNTQYSNQNPFRVTEGTNFRGIGVGLDARTATDDAYFSTRNNTNITSANSSFPFVTVNSSIRIGGAFGTDVAASFNGSTPVVSSPAYVFGTENQMEIMGNKAISGTSNQYNGHTRRLTFWPTRLSNSTLQAVTQ